MGVQGGDLARHAVPLLERLFKGGPRRRTACIALIKAFQQSTRSQLGLVLVTLHFPEVQAPIPEWLTSPRVDPGRRYLQSVCCHSKLTASVALANHVPLVKKAMEVFVYSAKAMLAANDCSEAFSLGTLVNRSLVTFASHRAQGDL